MPKYDYKCYHCGTVVEREFEMKQVKEKVKCHSCGKMAKRSWQAPNFICRYSYMERVQGNPRVNRGKGRR